MADGNQQQYQLSEGETFVPRQRAAAPAPVAAPQPTTDHPALNKGETFTPSNRAATAPTSEDTDKTWGSVAGVPYKKSSFDPTHMASEAGTGLMEMGTGLLHTAGDVLLPQGNTEGERLKYLGNKYIVEPWKAEQAKAQTALNQDPSHPIRNQIESAGHGILANVPLVGPWASSIAEQAGTGDVGGAAAKFGTQVAAAEYGPKVIKGGAEIVRDVPTVWKGLKAMKAMGDAAKRAQLEKENIGLRGQSEELKDQLSESEYERANAKNPNMDAARQARAQAVGATIPQPGEIPTVKDLANQVVDQNIKPTPKPEPGKPIYDRTKAEVPNTPGLAPEAPAAAPKEAPAEAPKRTSAHHVYGDEVGDELRDKPDLQSYFNGKKGEGFTNVKARQALLNAGHDMGQAVVNSKMLQGEGAITPGKAVEILRGRGYSMEQIRDLAEKPAK